MALKVTLEVTKDSWTWKVLENDTVVAENTMKRDPRGGFRGTQKAHIWEDALSEFFDLEENIEDGDVMGIANTLEVLE